MDLGTNTFHLLIAEGDIDNFREIVHQHVAVKIGEGGINIGIITPAAFERGLDTMRSFQKEIAANHVQQIKAIATSALRSASNGNDFIQQVKSETGIEIEIINGDREAEYIYKGVKATSILSANNSLIMDIGGGSVEFIICNNKHLIWKQSFEIGAARLMEMFHRTDPIPPDAVEALNLYLEDTLTNLFNVAQSTPIDNLVGSSGAFETFAELIELERKDTFDLKKITSYNFDETELLEVTGRLIRSSHGERLANEKIIPVRVDMIVIASLITRYIMQKLAIRAVQLCTYSLKEGVLAEMMSTSLRS